MKKEAKGRLLKRFLIYALVIFFSWKSLYHLLIKPDGRIDDTLTTWVVMGTVNGLKVLGFSSRSDNNVIYIEETPSVAVADGCNGLELTVLFIGFFICFPGRIKFKVIYIALGTTLLFVLNILREMALALNYNYFRKSFELNHKYTFALIVYLVVFLIWKKWISNHSAIKN